MTKQDTISMQEVRRDPLSFLRQINDGKTMVVIYHSKPYATVTSADKATLRISGRKGTKRMLEYAKLARDSAQSSHDQEKSYKGLYSEDMAHKYDIS